MSRFYVYALLDPRDSKPFYIGKGTGARIDAHEREAQRGVRSRKCDRIRQIEADGKKVVKVVLDRFEVEADAYDYEAQEIERIGLGNLTNVVPGGVGGYASLLERAKASRNRKFRQSDLDRLAPRLPAFFAALSRGERLVLHGTDFTDAIITLLRDLVKALGLPAFLDTMRKHGVVFV